MVDMNQPLTGIKTSYYSLYIDLIKLIQIMRGSIILVSWGTSIILINLYLYHKRFNLEQYTPWIDTLYLVFKVIPFVAVCVPTSVSLHNTYIFRTAKLTIVFLVGYILFAWNTIPSGRIRLYFLILYLNGKFVEFGV